MLNVIEIKLKPKVKTKGTEKSRLSSYLSVQLKKTTFILTSRAYFHLLLTRRTLDPVEDQLSVKTSSKKVKKIMQQRVLQNCTMQIKLNVKYLRENNTEVYQIQIILIPAILV